MARELGSLGAEDDRALLELEHEALGRRLCRETWVAWASALGWQYKLELTYRVGAEGCTRDKVEIWEAQRSMTLFWERLSEWACAPCLCLAALEWQRRGAPHWHVLLRVGLRGSHFRLEHHTVEELWQRWRTWAPEKRSRGVEGFVWLRRVKHRCHITDVVEYALKGGLLTVVSSEALPFPTSEGRGEGRRYGRRGQRRA